MTHQRSQSLRTFVALAVTLVVAGGLGVSPATAQAFGTIEGQVTRSDGGPLSSVLVSVAGTGIATSSGIDGRYTLLRVPAGPQTVLFRRLGYAPVESPATVTANARTTVDVTLESAPMMLGEIIVEGASRAPERVVEAPAAVSVIPRDEIRDISITGQMPLALANVPGVDIVQSGINDFNVNARGFNSSLNRRILVLQDGRDLAIAFLGSQEWPALAFPPGD
ncbi:MAG: carboxypeptidase regulatory-like domain-containing protein, partial [Gemmatimonadetes bacterium]|nr:carboxypeptidase regulatory-like domain-containing protein [Gemmatimonadota bacterium]